MKNNPQSIDGYFSDTYGPIKSTGESD